MRRILPILLTVFAATPCYAQISSSLIDTPVSEMPDIVSADESPQGDSDEQNMGPRKLPLRSKRPATFYISAGNPAPAFIGINMGFQFDPAFQILAGLGVAWYGDLTVRTFAATARFHLLKTRLAPMMGGGLTYFRLSGHGNIQGLETSTMLGSLLVGFDWAFKSGLRVSGGYTFHYPVKLNFPFVDVGWSF